MHQIKAEWLMFHTMYVTQLFCFGTYDSLTLIGSIWRSSYGPTCLRPYDGFRRTTAYNLDVSERSLASPTTSESQTLTRSGEG